MYFDDSTQHSEQEHMVIVQCRIDKHDERQLYVRLRVVQHHSMMRATAEAHMQI